MTGIAACEIPSSRRVGTKWMRTILSTLFADDLGVTAIEYALIAGIIAIVAIAAKASIGNSMNGFIMSVTAGL